MYVSQLRSVPVGLYDYYVYFVDASTDSAHSPVIANAMQQFAEKSGTEAVMVHGPHDLSMELFQFLREHAPADFGRLEHLFHETTSLVISEGALQTTTSQVFVLPLLPASAITSTHEELFSELVEKLLDAMLERRVAEFCMSLGAEPMELTDLRGGLIVSTLRRLNETLELKPNVAGMGLNLNHVIESIVGPHTRPLPE